MRSIVLGLIATLGICGIANASPFDGWTLEQLKAHPRFVAIESHVSQHNAMMFQREWNSPDAPLTHNWIGYISAGPEDEWDKVLIDEHGALSTVTGGGEHTGYDDIVIWCVDAIDYLFECGYIEGYP